MPEPGVAPGPEPLLGSRLAAVLAEISGAPSFAAAAQSLAESFAAAVGSPAVRLYALAEDDPAIRFVAAAGSAGGGGPPTRVSLDDRQHPLVLTALSLFALGCVSGEALDDPGGDGGGRGGPWVVVPLPQPMAAWSPMLLEADVVAAAAAAVSCQIVTLQPGERRRRLGLAPFGAVAVRLPAHLAASAAAGFEAAVAALLPAATLGGPILARSQAVERHRDAAERLDRQRDLLSEIIDSLPDPVVLIAPQDAGPARDAPRDAARDVAVLAQNRRAAELFDLDPAATAPRRRAVALNALLLAAYLGERAAGDGAAGAPGAAAGGSAELTLVGPDDGSDLLFEVGDHALGALASAAASPAGARLLVLRDVTELRRAAGQLERQVRRARLAELDARRERDRLDLLLDYVADPILMTDAGTAVVESNRQAERLFPVGKTVSGASTGEQPTDAALERMRANLETFRGFVGDFTASGESSRRGRLALTHPVTGGALPVEVVAGTVRGTPGGPAMVVSVVHDQTTQVENERLYEELKRFSQVLEARVRAATADLADQNARLQWQSRELEKANRLKSEFLASMSHELRTPINALIGYTALMLDRVYGDLTPKQEEGLRRAQAAAQHLLALINDILDLAKIEAGRMPVHFETVAVAAVVREVAVQVDPMARGKRVEFTTEVEAELPAIETDPTKLTQILLNLAANAVKFTPAGRVTLRAHAVDGGQAVRFEVVDTGIGIRAEDLGVIWEDFRQLDQSRTREFGGTGLGLSIVKKLSDRLGAEVGVESEVGVGSTFWVEVPREQAPRTREPGHGA